MRNDLKPSVLRLTFVVDVIFLVWHTLLLFVFGYSGVWILAGVNVFSVCVYIYTLLALKRRRPCGVLWMMYVELMFHMIISVLCMGWDCGFQEYAFGIVPIMIFGEYIEAENQLSGRSLAKVMSVGVCYLLLNIWTHTHEPFYGFATEKGTQLFGMINGSAAVFAVSVYFLLFTRMVLGFERGLIHDASYDSLTGLANRRVLYEYAGRLEENADYCVFMIDIDNFKVVNDTYGHDVGDRVLEAIGELLTECKYKLNHFSPHRWGGEEFVVIYSDAAMARGEKIRQMERIRQRIGELCVVADGDDVRFTATVGAAVSGEEKTIDGLISLADSRMYYGKRQGKNCLVYTHDEWRNI